MEASKVYYTDFRCPVGTSLLEKLRRVCIAAGIKDIDMEGKFVAIKMHFGELGNLSYSAPQLRQGGGRPGEGAGGIPFLTDCNTLYPGSRKNATGAPALRLAERLYSHDSGCPVIIGDGLKGTDEARVPVPGGDYCKKRKDRPRHHGCGCVHQPDPLQGP